MDKPAQVGNANLGKQDNSVVAVKTQPTPIASSVNKEIGVSSFSEVVKPSEAELKVSEELKNVGVSVNTDKPRLEEIHQQIGVTASLDVTPVDIESDKANVVMPMTEDEADKTLKMKQSKFNIQENVGEFAGEYTEDSLPFFATLIKKVFKEMHKRVFRKGN